VIVGWAYSKRGVEPREGPTRDPGELRVSPRVGSIGICRTDYESPDDDPEEPRLGVRRSVWERNADVDRAEQADDLHSYLASGPQIADRFLFTNRIRHPWAAEMTDVAVSAIARGVSVESAQRLGGEWNYVRADLTDDRLTTTIAYDSSAVRSEALESVLSTCLAVGPRGSDGEIEKCPVTGDCVTPGICGSPEAGTLRAPDHSYVADRVLAPVRAPRQRITNHYLLDRSLGKRRERPVARGSCRQR
jgi:hypothetical protein